MHVLHNILILTVFVWCVSTANILLVPGIGGSMLYSEDKLASSKQNPYQHIWPVAISQDSLLRRAISRQVFPNGTYVPNRYEVYVPQGGYGLSAMYDLNPELLLYKTATYYMKTLIDMLVGQNFTMGVDLFGFPYDWRYPVNYRPHLDSLEKILNSKPNEEWFVIAHSMGGLVMQEYFKSGLSNNRNDSHITLITVGTPFHGVGGRSLQAFTTGYNFGNSRLPIMWQKNSPSRLFPLMTYCLNRNYNLGRLSTSKIITMKLLLASFILNECERENASRDRNHTTFSTAEWPHLTTSSPRKLQKKRTITRKLSSMVTEQFPAARRRITAVITNVPSI